MGLVNWAVSEVMKRGFTPLTTPEIVRSSVVEKCGFQPRGTNTQVISYVVGSLCSEYDNAVTTTLLKMLFSFWQHLLL